MQHFLRPLLALSFGLAGSQPLFAQVELLRFSGANQGDMLGLAVDSAGDTNGDGYDDLLVGAPGYNAVPTESGAGFIYSGLDGSLLHTLLAPGHSFQLGTTLAGLGDLNGDGYDDVIVGDPRFGGFDGAAYVYSGIDGSLMHALYGQTFWEARFGSSLSAIDDVDGDGVGDFLIGAPGDGLVANGKIRLYSGATGNVLMTITGAANEIIGATVAGLDDIDGDGVPDIGTTGFAGSIPFLRIYRGNSPVVISNLPLSFTASVSLLLTGTADLDGDGIGDLVVADRSHNAIGPWSGQIRALSSASGTLLFKFDGRGDYSQLGSSIDSLPDTNGDGIDDLLVGSPGDHVAGPSWGGAYLLSGADGSILQYFGGEDNGGLPGQEESFGQSVAHAGDTNGDGYPDVIIGAFFANPGALFGGEARVFSTLPFESYCSSSPNSTGSPAQIRGRGTASVHRNDLTLEASSVPNTVGLFFYGPNQVQLPFGNGQRCVGGSLFRLPSTVATGNLLSSALDLTSLQAAGSILAGSDWNFQAWFRDPAAGGASFDLSDGMRVTFQL